MHVLAVTVLFVAAAIFGLAAAWWTGPYRPWWQRLAWTAFYASAGLAISYLGVTGHGS